MSKKSRRASMENSMANAWLRKGSEDKPAVPSNQKTVTQEKGATLFSPYGKTFEKKTILRDTVPTIFVSQRALTKMYYYVDMASTEIGWLGTVSEVEGGYLIEDTFLVEQTVDMTETEMTIDGLAELGTRLLGEGRDAEYAKIRLWGHSHVNMGVSPSGTDEQTMVQLKGDDTPWFIRVIANKRGDMKFWVYRYDKDLEFHDCAWEVYNPVDTSLRDEIAVEFEAKVKRTARTGTVTYVNGHKVYGPAKAFAGPVEYDDFSGFGGFSKKEADTPDPRRFGIDLPLAEKEDKDKPTGNAKTHFGCNCSEETSSASELPGLYMQLANRTGKDANKITFDLEGFRKEVMATYNLTKKDVSDCFSEADLIAMCLQESVEVIKSFVLDAPAKKFSKEHTLELAGKTVPELTAILAELLGVKVEELAIDYNTLRRRIVKDYNILWADASNMTMVDLLTIYIVEVESGKGSKEVASVADDTLIGVKELEKLQKAETKKQGKTSKRLQISQLGGM